MTYPEALNYIASLEQRGWRLGLDRMQEFANRAGLVNLPQKFIHVAGTNGKGSVTAYLQSLLVCHGYRTGAFFSPYVYSPRERVQFGFDYISKEDFALLTEELCEVAEGMEGTTFGGPTEFEFKTALGLLYWKRMNCEWVALETCLGGRLDATNIITPEACVITSISLDHTNILGHTVEEIAREKAGIIKPGAPVVVGRIPEPAFEAIRDKAGEMGSQIYRLDHDFGIDNGRLWGPGFEITDIQPGIPGLMQPENCAAAAMAWIAAGNETSEDLVRLSACNATIPGRFQSASWKGVDFILDGAHNPESADNLARSLESAGVPKGSLTLLTNMLTGHEMAPFYGPLREWVREVWVVPIDFPRARSVVEAAEELRRTFKTVVEYRSIRSALELLSHGGSPGRVLVTGSFYLVGEVGRAIGLGGD